MSNVTIEITQNEIVAGIGKCLTDALANGYNNPIKSAVEKAIKEKEAAIKAVVDEVITAAITDPKFKEKVAELVLARMIEATLKK